MQHLMSKYIFVSLLLIATLSCSSIFSTPQALSKSLPPGTLVLKFTRNIKGPIELSIDGVRINVEQTNKGGNALTVSGLEIGAHQFLISSQNDAFGPNSSEFALPDDEGIIIPIFSQSFNSILYGNTSSAPAPENPKNIKAILRTL